MIRTFAVASGLVLTGVAAAGAWALGWAPAASMARLRALVEPAPADRTSPSGYPIRLELPQAQGRAAGAATPAPANDLGNAATLSPDQAVLSADEGGRPPAARAAMSSRPGLLDVQFDIATFGKVAPPSGGRTIRTSKSLNHGGSRVGSVDLALGQGSVVSVDRQALQTLVGDKDENLAAALAGMEGEMVSFDALRDRGVRIRYDPLADAVVIDGGT